MHQVAVFVDAGYLFAASSALLSGTKQPREQVSLDIEKAVKSLTDAAAVAAPSIRMLRIYWYDGIRPYQGPSSQQAALGLRPNIKLRLGMINSHGQQKGVDSLIVTDLIDLARNNAISDALILAGDEDLRVGVQVAQTYGVRVHLLGIEPSRGNQSQQLLQEVDGHGEWSKSDVSEFISCVAAAMSSATTPSPTRKPHNKPVLEQPDPMAPQTLNADKVISKILERFDTEKLQQIREVFESTRSLPRDVDAPIMAEARHVLGRDLTVEEKRQMRKTAQTKILAETNPR